MSVVSSGYTATVPIQISNPLLWKFLAPEDSTIVFTSAKVQQPLNQQIVEQVGTFRPLGRGKAVVVSGSLYGVDGTYVITTTGQDEWDSLYTILSYQGTLQVQDPLGRQKYIRFTERNWQEMGIIGNVKRSIKITYVEVDKP